MGSLMAGWDSPVQDPNFVKLMRNKSLTREKIEEYWRLKKKTEQEHLKAISPRGDTSEKVVSFTKESVKELTRTSSLPMLDTEHGRIMTGKDIEDFMKKNGWWTRSNWAFLNEPPVIEAEVPRYNYVAQHHVANLATSKPENLTLE